MNLNQATTLCLVCTGLTVILPASAERLVENYNGGWEFSHDQKTWEKVAIPHDWAIEGPFDRKLPASSGCLPWKGIGWYRKTFVLKAKPRGCRTFLDFGGIQCDGTIFVNNSPAGHEPYGYLGIKTDITSLLETGTNTVLVRADTTKLASRWYPGAGMYRNVRKIETDDLYLDTDHLVITTPDVTREKATVNIRGIVQSRRFAEEKGEVIVKISNPSGKVVAQSSVAVPAVPVCGNAAFETALTVVNPKLWTMTPYAALYTVEVTFKAKNATDAVAVKTGFRTFKFDADKGFFLNGERVQLKGIDLHADLGILGMAFNKSAMRRQLEIMRDMGANALRTSHNPPAPEVLDLCDEMGFFVWDECFDKWNATSGRKDENLDEYVSSHLTKFVRRDRNHPCVFVWSIGNEILSGKGFPPGQEMWGMRGADGTNRERCTRFRNIVLAEDKSRPVGIGCCFPDAVEHEDYAELDITGWNYRELYKSMKAKYPAKPVLYSESASAFSVYGYYYPQQMATNKAHYVGATSMIDSYDHNSAWWSDIPDLEFERMERDTYVGGEFVWTGIDYLGEPSPYDRGDACARSSYFGICDLLGFPKDRYYLYRSHWNTESFTLHIVPHHWNFEGVKTLPVYVYSNAKEVELFVNGVSQGRRQKNPKASFSTGYYDVLPRYRFVWKDIAYQAGEVKAVAYDASGKTLGTQTIRTAGPAAKVVVEPETTDLSDDLNELVFFKVTLVDAKGVPVPNDDRYVNIVPEGACAVVAVGNGNPCGMESFKVLRGHHLHMGRCGFAVRRLRPGAANVRVTADGLISGEFTFASGEDED